MTVIIDYGVGNLFSLSSSLKSLGEEVKVSGNASDIKSADRLILPGVGAFGDAAKKLRENGLDKLIIEQASEGKPLLGICLGMQLLFDKSYEYGEYQGLGLIPGEVVPMQGKIPEKLKIPHIGWNALQLTADSPIFKYITKNEHVYFVHSYYGENCGGSVIATAGYGRDLTAAVQNGKVYGCQFHPEKSGQTGLNILRAFCEEVET